MYKTLIRTAAVVAVGAAFAAPPLASAQTKSHESSVEAKGDDSKGGDSEFEKTRQHMIEKNRESQRTGQM